MSMEICSTCKKHVFNLAAHQRLDVFEAITPEYGSKWDEFGIQEVHADDHEEAAKLIGEREGDQGEGPFEGVVEVRRRGEADVQRFNVSHEYSVDYYAAAAR